MRDQKESKLLEFTPQVSSSSSLSSSEHYLGSAEHLSTRVAYNEMADVPVQYVDPVAEVQKNMAQLQEIQARMKFMMREIRYLMKL